MASTGEHVELVEVGIDSRRRQAGPQVATDRIGIRQRRLQMRIPQIRSLQLWQGAAGRFDVELLGLGCQRQLMEVSPRDTKCLDDGS